MSKQKQLAILYTSRVTVNDTLAVAREVLPDDVRIANVVDVTVLAQGSMAVVQPDLAGWGLPALTSPRLGMQLVKEMLDAI